MTTREALGVDIGGVIITRVAAGADTSFLGERYVDTPEVPGALEGIRRLVDGRFGGRVFLVSKCGPRQRVKTLRWLKQHDFYNRTGVEPKHVRFCLERNEKAPICLDLGITHFVDDRLDVLLSLRTVPCRFLFDANSHGADDAPAAARSIRTMRSWREIADALTTP